MEMIVRPADLADAAALVAGNVAMAEETEGLALHVETVRAGVAAVLEGRARGRYFVLEAEGAVAAQLMITFEWSDWRAREVWWIQSVYVWPAHRGRGAYRRLYEHVQAAAKAEGAAGLRLYVDTRNTRAAAVYEALGMNGEHYRVYEAMF